MRFSRVICIDDGSSDGTLALLRRFEQAQGGLLQVIAQNNKGRALALNRGLAEVDTEVFVCIDADTQVLPDTLAVLVGTLVAKRVAAVSGQMMVGGEGHGLVQRAQVCEYEVANNIERRIQSRFGCITGPGTGLATPFRPAVARHPAPVADRLPGGLGRACPHPAAAQPCRGQTDPPRQRAPAAYPLSAQTAQPALANRFERTASPSGRT